MMSEGPSNNVFHRLQRSPNRNNGLSKPAMRTSPRKIKTSLTSTSPRYYKIPPRRLESPESLRNSKKFKTENNSILMNVNSSLSPLRPKRADGEVLHTVPQLLPEPKEGSPIGESISHIDSSPVRGRNILSKLKQEISMIDSLDGENRLEKIRDTKEENTGDTTRNSNVKKSVRFNLVADERESMKTKPSIEALLSQDTADKNSIITSDLHEIKYMLSKIIQTQRRHDELLKDMLEKQEDLKEIIEMYNIKKEDSKDR